MLAATCLSTLVVNANTSAVSILLPAISEDTGTPVSSLQWAVTGYSLVGAAVIITSGSLGDVFGRRRVFQLGLALFVVSCVFIGLSTSGEAVIVGRFIQGAAGATILACGLSLLTVANSGQEQLRAVSLWGAAAAVGAAAGPLIGGVLVGTTGWQGLFWIDAAVAVVCMVITRLSVSESRDENRSRSIDYAGTVLVALTLGPLILALSEGSDWGWTSFATLATLAVTVGAGFAFVAVESRVKVPLLDLALLRNRILVGVDGGDPHRRRDDQRTDVRAEPVLPGPGGSRLLGAARRAWPPCRPPSGWSWLPRSCRGSPRSSAAGRSSAWGSRSPRPGSRSIGLGDAGWKYGAYVLPLIAIAVGMGLSNGPASSASTSCVPAHQVGSASGVSNMARYVGAAVATALAASIFSSVTTSRTDEGASASDALASGLSATSWVMAVFSVVGILMAVLMGRHREAVGTLEDSAAAAAAHTHTLPTSATPTTEPATS